MSPVNPSPLWKVMPVGVARAIGAPLFPIGCVLLLSGLIIAGEDGNAGVQVMLVGAGYIGLGLELLMLE